MSFTTEAFDVGNGRTMAIDHAGQGSAIVLIHGIPGGPQAWHPVGMQLAQHHHVIIPHLLGFAGSSRPSEVQALWADAQAAAIQAALARLGIQSAMLVGHDFGGPVAAMLLRQPQVEWTHLALLSANIFTDTPIPFPLSLTTLPAVGALAKSLIFSRPSLAMMLRQGVGRGGTVLQPGVYLGDHAQDRAIAAIFAYALSNIQSLYAPIEAALAGSRLPTLVAWGDQDPFFSAAQGRRTAEFVGGEFILFQGAGHFLPAERPAELVDALARHLSTRAHAVGAF